MYASFVALAFLGSVVLCAQQTPTFRTRTDLQRLDVTVVDNKTGKPISDLTERDFTITENGARQTIAAFATQQLEADLNAANRPVSPIRGADALAPGSRRTFLFVFTPSQVKGADGPIKAVDGLLQFIRERLLPQDLVAVMAFNRITVLTTDHQRIAQVVERLRDGAPKLSMNMRVDSFNRRGEGHWSQAIQDEIDAMLQPPGAAVPFFRSATSFLAGTDSYKLNEKWPIKRNWEAFLLGSDLLKIYVGIEYLRAIEGQKHIVVFTRGMRMPIRILNMPAGIWMNDKDDEARLAARAMESQIAIDIIETSGTAPAMMGNQSPGSPSGSYVASLGTLIGYQGLQNVSALTGGQFTSVRTAVTQLGRIDEATRTGYVLGYAPTNPQLDGKYRKIDVKVNRPNVTVLTRRGYVASDELETLDMRQVVTNDRIRDAAATDLQQDDIKIKAKASFEKGAGKAGQVRVEVSIDPARLTIVENGGKREGSIDLVILCGDGEQRVVGVLKQRMTLSMDDAHYQQAMTTGIPYATSIPLTGPATYVKVMVYDYGADVLGVTNVNIK